jgi:hypothetical protein
MWRRYTATLTLVLAVALTAGADLETVVHVFQLRYASVTEASAAIQPMLSDRGSITVQPRQARITVQDLPEVVQRVADLIVEIDRLPKSYRIQVELLEGTSRPIPAEQQIRVDERLAGMFKFPSFRRLGSAVFEGDLGSPSSAELGSGFKISFLAEPTGFSQDSPWGTPDPGDRIHLRWLQLDRLRTTDDGRRTSDEVLRTSIFIAPKQKVFIGAGKSEDSTDGLVLIVEAQDVGGG